MTLYNIFTERGGYRIAKWDDKFNLIGSYLTTSNDCDCPSRVKPCKHVRLVDVAMRLGVIDKPLFLDPDTGKWEPVRLWDQEFEPLPIKRSWRRI